MGVQAEVFESSIELECQGQNGRSEPESVLNVQEESLGDGNDESEQILIHGSRSGKAGTKDCEDHQSDATPTRLSTIRKLSLAIYLNVFICQSIRALVVAALPLHILDLGGDSSDVGAIISAYGLGYTLINIPGGWLLVAMGPKLVFFISCVLFIISPILAILAESISFVMLILGSSAFILGAATSLSLLAWQTFVGAEVAKEHRGLAMSTMGGISRAGYSFGPFVAGILSVKFGTTAVFVAQIILSFLAVVVAASFMPAHISDSSDTGGSSTGCQKAREVVRQNYSAILRIMGFIFALAFVRKARELFFALAGRDIALSADLVGHLTALSYFFDMICFPIAGRIMDSCGRKVAGVISLATQSIGIFLLLHRTVFAIFLSAFLTGVGNGLSSGIVMTIGSDLSPPGSARGPFLAVYRTLANFPELVVPAVIGYLCRYTSLFMAELISSILGLLGIFWVITCMPETLPRDKSSFDFACCSVWSLVPSQAELENEIPATRVGRQSDST